MINKEKVIHYWVSLLLALLVFGQSQAIASSQTKVFDYEADVMQQYLWMHPPGTADDSIFTAAIKKGDPLNASVYAFNNFYYERDIKKTKGMVDEIIEKWDLYKTHKLDYPYQYNQMAPGWWSAMDNMFFPLLLVAVNQVEENPKYARLASDMLSNVLRSPQEGGVLWEDNGSGCWFSEYSWEGMQEQDESYVLNGHLFALQALKHLADSYEGSLNLEELYDCAVKGTKEKSDSFFNKDSTWLSYMLNPKTINPPHYVIFETIQFSNLYSLTGDVFFKDQEEDRRDVLSKRYPIYIIESNGNRELLFSLMGAPHPYLLDIYGISISCINQNYSEVIYSNYHQFDKNRSIVERAFINEDIGSNDLKECSITSRKRGMDFVLYKTSSFNTIKNDFAPKVIKVKSFSASLDAYQESEEGEVIINPAIISSEAHDYLNTQGRLSYEFDEAVVLTEDSFFGIELTPSHDLQIGIHLGSSGLSVFRYYPNLKAGKKNLILLSKLGFDNGDGLTKVTNSMVTVYTHNQEEVASIEIGNSLVFRNQAEIFVYLNGSDAIINLVD